MIEVPLNCSLYAKKWFRSSNYRNGVLEMVRLLRERIDWQDPAER